MAIQYTMTVQDNTLLVKASGFDEDLAGVQAYGTAIITAAVAASFDRVLCDERDLEYRLDTLDIYTVGEFIAARAPRVARVAIIPAKRYAADARFWENVVVNRGLTVRVFEDDGAAWRWLHEQ